MKTKYFKPIVIPNSYNAGLKALAEAAHFSDHNGRNMAQTFEDQGFWVPADCAESVFVGSFGTTTYDCVHSQYAAVLHLGIAGCAKLLSISGLYRLAAFLADNPQEWMTEIDELTVAAFGSPRLSNKLVLNGLSHTAGNLPDMRTAVLYITNGVPRSVYEVWHTDEKDSSVNFALTYPAYLAPNLEVDSAA